MNKGLPQNAIKPPVLLDLADLKPKICFSSEELWSPISLFSTDAPQPVRWVIINSTMAVSVVKVHGWKKIWSVRHYRFLDLWSSVPGLLFWGFGDLGSTTALVAGEEGMNEQPLVAVSISKLVRRNLSFFWLLPCRQTSTALAAAKSPRSS